MSDPFLGEIRIVAFSFPPRGWAACNGQILPIQQNTALFSLLGVNYGGNGTTNFALPNFQNAAPMHWGNGTGLSPRVVGEQGGSTAVTLLGSELPAHLHLLESGALSPQNPAQNVAAPTSTAFFGVSNAGQAYSDVATPAVNFLPTAITQTGGNQPHENRQPILTLNFVIALQGIYPARN
jgi:microcystin-dependent protein